MTKREQARLAVAAVGTRCGNATEGPWMWQVNLASKHTELRSLRGLRATVLRPWRWGMQSATFQFVVNRLMERVDDKGLTAKIPGQEHNASWNRTIDHPDADYIAHARTDLPLFLEAFLDADKELETVAEAYRDAGRERTEQLARCVGRITRLEVCLRALQEKLRHTVGVEDDVLDRIQWLLDDAAGEGVNP